MTHIFSIIGTPFYLMEYVQGKIHKDPSLPGMTPEERKKVYSAMNRTIAKIHTVDVHQAGVADYGKHGNDDNDTFWIMFGFVQMDMLADRSRPGHGSMKPAKQRKLRV